MLFGVLFGFHDIDGWVLGGVLFGVLLRVTVQARACFARLTPGCCLGRS